MSLWDVFLSALKAMPGKSIGISFHRSFSWAGNVNPPPALEMGNSKFFTDAELAGLKDELPAMLEMARGYAGVPFVLTSTVRTCAGNQAALGAEHSTHILGLAVDIGLGHLPEGGERDVSRFMILRGLLQAGFTRIGLYGEHIHADIGQAPDYVQSVAWFSPDA